MGQVIAFVVGIGIIDAMMKVLSGIYKRGVSKTQRLVYTAISAFWIYFFFTQIWSEYGSYHKQINDGFIGPLLMALTVGLFIFTFALWLNRPLTKEEKTKLHKNKQLLYNSKTNVNIKKSVNANNSNITVIKSINANDPYEKLLSEYGDIDKAYSYYFNTLLKERWAAQTQAKTLIDKQHVTHVYETSVKKLNAAYEKLKKQQGLNNPQKKAHRLTKKLDVYEVPQGARGYEALGDTGGFADGANQEAVNLAAKLSDGEHVKVLRRGEQQAGSTSSQNRTESAAPAASAPGAARVNINTADITELMSVGGFGAKTAQMVLEYRKENGLFGRTEDIMNVRGIGPKRYESIKDQITVGKSV